MDNLFTDFSHKIYKTKNYDLNKLDIRQDIHMNNTQILKVTSLMMMAVFMIMFVLSFLVDNYAKHRFFYGFEVVETLTVLLASAFVLPKKPKLELVFVYFFTGLMYYYGIHVGVLSQQNNLAVTSCLFLTAMPLIFVDDALRILMFSFLAAVINVVLMIKFKSGAVLATDLTDVFFSWGMGLGLAFESNRIKIHSYIREHEIALERDTDGLTGLWNKNALVRKITERINTPDSRGAFFIIDLDHFKQLNDTLGHSFGDDVLSAAARCAKKVFGENDILGRFGGDEFIFYMDGADSKAACSTAENLLYAFYDEVKLPTEDKWLRASIGIAEYTYDPDMTYDSIMKKADRALYITKEQGRFGYTVYSEGEMERITVDI